MKKILIILAMVFALQQTPGQRGPGGFWMTEEPQLVDLTFGDPNKYHSRSWQHWKGNKYIFIDSPLYTSSKIVLATVEHQGDPWENASTRVLFTPPNNGGAGWHPGIQYISKIVDNQIFFCSGTTWRYRTFLHYDLEKEALIEKDVQIVYQKSEVSAYEKKGNYYYFLVNLEPGGGLYYKGSTIPFIKNEKPQYNRLVLFRTDLDYKNYELIASLENEAGDITPYSYKTMQVSSQGNFLIGLYEVRTDNGWNLYKTSDYWEPPISNEDSIAAATDHSFNSRYVLIDPKTKTILKDKKFKGHVSITPGKNNNFFFGYSGYQKKPLNFEDYLFNGKKQSFTKGQYVVETDANWTEIRRSQVLLPHKSYGDRYNFINRVIPFEDKIIVVPGTNQMINGDFFQENYTTIVLDRDLRRREFYSSTLADYGGIWRGVRLNFSYRTYDTNGYYATSRGNPGSVLMEGGERLFVFYHAHLNDHSPPGESAYSYYYPFPDLSGKSFSPKKGVHGLRVIDGQGLGSNNKPKPMQRSSILVSTENFKEGDFIGKEHIVGGQPEKWMVLYGQAIPKKMQLDIDFRDFNIGVIRKDKYGNLFTTIEINNQGQDLEFCPVNAPMSQSNNGVYWRIYLSNDMTLSNNEVQESIENTSTSVSVYPNPNKGQFMIHGLNEKTSMNLFSLSGLLVYTKELLEDQDIYLPHLSEGLYILQLKNKKGILSKKIIIQK